MYIPHNIRCIQISYGKCSNTSVSNCTMFFFSRTIIGRDRCLSSRLARWTRYRTTRHKNVRPEIFCPMLTSNSKLCQHHQTCIHCFFLFACFSQRLSTIVRTTIATLVPWWTKVFDEPIEGWKISKTLRVCFIEIYHRTNIFLMNG